MERLQASSVIVLFGCLALSCTSGGAEGPRPRAGKSLLGEGERYRGRPQDPSSKGEGRSGTGISQVGRVAPGGPALPSTLSPGVELERLWSDQDDWEPIVAADPSSDWIYQMTTRLDGVGGRVVFRASSDGGLTYGPDQRVGHSGRQQYDPQLAVTADGTVFACWLEVPGWETFVARSLDHGATWSTPVVVETTVAWTDHPWLAVSADGQHVYVAFNRSDSFVVASHDGGASFEPPVLTHRTGRTWYHTGGAVAPDGAIYFGGAEYHERYNGPTRINVLRSTDEGASFQKIFLDRSLSPPVCWEVQGCYWGFLGPCTSLAIDSEGTIVFAYNAGRTFIEPQQIWVRVSKDGELWSQPQSISFPEKEANNAFPVVVSGPEAGDFSVVWQGDRNGGLSDWNTWLRRSFDGGLTWGPIVQLSTRADGAPYKTDKGYGFPYGDYMSATSDRLGRVHALWGAGANYDGPGGTWYTRTK